VRGKLSSSAFAFPRLAAASREENLLLRVIRRPLFAPLALALLIASAATWSFQEHWDAKPLSADQLAHIREGLEPNPAGGFFVTARLNEGLGEKQLGKLPFLGEVFILTDGATFSTAADFCAVTHHLKRAVFIGEETAGAYYGNNSGTEPTVTLPHSKVRFGLPLTASWNAVSGYDGKRPGTIPDHVAVMKTADVLRGVDAPLELAVKLAGG
jgi:hypothetical protein